jgi:hypothetical protein
VLSLLLSVFLRRRGASKRILIALGSVWGIYLMILAVTDVLRPQKIFKAGEEQCFDEMCFAVAGVETIAEQASTASSTPTSRLYIVEVRVSSHSHGRVQAEGGLSGRLYDGYTYINVSEAAQQAYDAQHGQSPKLTQKIAPGESILSTLVFEVPQAITHPALILDHGFTPGYFIIGESPFLHEPAIHQLPNSQ